MSIEKLVTISTDTETNELVWRIVTDLTIDEMRNIRRLLNDILETMEDSQFERLLEEKTKPGNN